MMVDPSVLGSATLIASLEYPWALTDFLEATEVQALRAVRRAIAARIYVVQSTWHLDEFRLARAAHRRASGNG